MTWHHYRSTIAGPSVVALLSAGGVIISVWWLAKGYSSLRYIEPTVDAGGWVSFIWMFLVISSLALVLSAAEIWTQIRSNRHNLSRSRKKCVNHQRIKRTGARR